MNFEKVKESAIHLEILLGKYAANDHDAASLLNALYPLIFDVKTEKRLKPMEWREIPGAYFFTEGQLRKYPDLEKAFAEFRIEITGGDNPVLEMIQQQRL